MHEISTKIKKKNTKLETTLVLSNSATNGIISQNEYFDKDIANDENIDKYYVISKGDFVYNPRKSSNAPYGPINILEKYDEGIVSPLYTCFSIKTDKQEFLKYYFKSNKWHRFIYINGDKGARGDRVSIKDDVFYKMPIMIPNYLESEKISNLLSLLERKITIARSKYETLKKYKKGFINKEIFGDHSISLKHFLFEISEKTKTNNEFDIVSSTVEGCFLQKDYFNYQVASENNIGYKIIRKNQIILSPQNLWLGNINLNDCFDVGMVSPSYKIFTVRNIHPKYLIELLKTTKMKYLYKTCSEQGASVVRRNLNIDQLLKSKIAIHTGTKQTKITNILLELDKLIKNSENKLKLIVLIKTQLLNELFI